MPRRKGQATKIATETKQKLILPTCLKDDILKTQKRFLFNIDQIEKRYCRSSSGITHSTDDDEIHFDADICTAQSDEEMRKLLKRQEKYLGKKARFGGSLLSTPAIDPDERDIQMVDKWKRLNKLFDIDFGVNSMTKDTVKPIGRQTRSCSAAIKRNHADILEKENHMALVPSETSIGLAGNNMRRKIRFSLDDKLLIRNIPLPMFNNVNKSLSLSNKIFQLNTNSNQKEDDDKQTTSSQPYYVTEPSASCSSSKNMLLLPLVNKMYQNSFQYSVEEPEDDEELPSSQYISQF